MKQMTMEKKTFETLKKEFKKKIKNTSCRMRFSSEQNITFADEQSTIRSRVSVPKNTNRCEVYLSGSLHHESDSLAELICDYFKDYTQLISINQLMLHGHYPTFANYGFERVGQSSWSYFHTPWVHPIYSFIQHVNEANRLLQRDDPTVDMYVGPFKYGNRLSPDIEWKELKLIIYKTGKTEQLALGNPLGDQLRLLKGEDVFPFSFDDKESLVEFFTSYVDQIHRRARLETVFQPVKHYFQQCMSKCEIYDSEARDKLYNRFLTHCDAEKLEELCASWVISIRNDHSVAIRSTQISLLSFFDEWYVVSGKEVAWFDDVHSAIAAFEEQVLAISLGKTLIKKLDQLKTKG